MVVKMQPHEIGHQFANACRRKDYPYVIFHGGKNIYLESAIPLFDILVLIDLLVANCDSWQKEKIIEYLKYLIDGKFPSRDNFDVLLVKQIKEEVANNGSKNLETGKSNSF